jgi:YesN/AraC family two-component response regulator
MIFHASEAFAGVNETFDDLVFYTGCSPVFNSINEIKQAYVQSQCALENRTVQDDSKIYFYSTELADKEPYVIPVSFEERYRKALSCGNYDVTETLLYEILDKNYARNITYSMYAKMCIYIIDLMERTVINSSDGEIVKSSEYLGKIDFTMDIIEMNDILMRNNKSICAVMNSRKKTDPGIEIIERYINNEFCGNINLDVVAGKFGYSPNYLSRMFKKVIGIGFQEYITKLRIERAKRLMADPKKSIRNVAEEVGYSNSSVFIKAFEKHEGISPGKYRNQADNTDG